MRRNRNKRFSPERDEDEDSYRSDYSEDFDKDSVRLSDESEYSRNRSPVTEQSQRTITIASSTKSEGRRPKKKQMYGSSYQNPRARSLTNQPKRQPNNVQQRVMSAKRNRYNQMNNELNEMRSKVDELNRENRLLKTLQHRQGKALKKLEDTESDLPRLIAQNNEEQRVLKARLRKSQQRERDLENKLRSANDDADKLDSQLRRYKKLVNERNLAERAELARDLSDTQDKLFEVERRNQELMRNLELNTQSYMRQIKTEQQKHQQTKNDLKRTTDDCNVLQSKLREKERQLDVSNIYALRGNRSFNSSSISANQSVVISSKHSTPRKEKPPPAEPAIVKKQSPLAITSSSSDVQPSKPPQRSHSPVSILAAMPPQQPKSHHAVVEAVTPPPPPVLERKKSIPLIKFDNDDSSFTVEKPAPAFFTEASSLSRLTQDVSDEDDIRTEIVSPYYYQSSIPSYSSKENTDFIDTLTKFEITPTTAELQVNAEAIRVKEEQEAKRKLEDEQRKKASLLAKMREIDEEENRRSPRESGSDELKRVVANTTSTDRLHSSTVPDPRDPRERDFDRDLACFFAASLALHKLNEEDDDDDEVEDDFSSAVTKRKSSKNSSLASTSRKKKVRKKVKKKVAGRKNIEAQISFERRVENLHQGIPTSLDASKEMTFGGYSPSVQSNPRRRSRPAPKRAGIRATETNDDDSPLLDLDSGKPNKKGENLLNQLFGDQTRENTDSTKRSNGKAVHDNYPWEKNVMPSKGGGGDARSNSREKLIVSPLTNARHPILDDDIEELAL